jgi:hypothetical protein
MTVIPVSPATTDLPVGGVWVMSVAVVDLDGLAVDVAPAVTVTLPGGTTESPVPEAVSTGGYRLAVQVLAAGRYVARFLSAHGAADFAAYATPAVAAGGMPDLGECREYLRLDPSDTGQDVEIQNALDAESAAQRSVCRVGAVYPDDLREALLRRVARNLALRGLPLAVLQGDAESGDTILPGRDPEVKRLEGPHRRLPIG